MKVHRLVNHLGLVSMQLACRWQPADDEGATAEMGGDAMRVGGDRGDIIRARWRAQATEWVDVLLEVPPNLVIPRLLISISRVQSR